MSDTRPPCRSCASMLADFSLFDTLKSEAGVDISQTAQDFYSAVDHDCGVCSAIHKVALRGRKSDGEKSLSAPFCCRPESPSSGSRNLIKNIHLETKRPDSYDFTSIRVAIWSAKNRFELDQVFDIEAQESKYTRSKAWRFAFGGFSNTLAKTIRQRNTSAPGR